MCFYQMSKLFICFQFIEGYACCAWMCEYHWVYTRVPSPPKKTTTMNRMMLNYEMNFKLVNTAHRPKTQHRYTHTYARTHNILEFIQHRMNIYFRNWCFSNGWCYCFEMFFDFFLFSSLKIITKSEMSFFSRCVIGILCDL